MREKKKKTKTQFSSTEVIILMLISVVTSVTVTSIIYSTDSSNENYEKVSGGLKTIIDVYNNITDKYYDDLDEDTLVNGAVDGMLSTLDDPYTTYMDSETYNNFNIELNGSYSGLGIQVSVIDEKLTIAGIFKDSPAYEVGMALGDIILSIDDKNTDDMSSSDFGTYIRENDNNKFKIVVDRAGEKITFNLEKKVITLKSVAAKVIEAENKKIGYIYMSIFASNTYQQFKEKLDDLTNQNINSLIIDLRSNSGGELVSASNIISLFLNRDKVMYQTQSKTETKQYYSKGDKDFEIPIVILVDSTSASASEVLASALKENINATIIGTKTFGKGTVQEMLTLSTGEQYKITTKKWLTPKGNWINKVGIIPDIEIELSEEYSKNPTEDNDNQLQEAIKYLKEQ